METLCSTYTSTSIRSTSKRSSDEPSGTSSTSTRPPQRRAASQNIGLSRTVIDAENLLALHRSLPPCERKVGIGLLLFFGFGLATPT
jgi:hypothetical protein